MYDFGSAKANMEHYNQVTLVYFLLIQCILHVYNITTWTNPPLQSAHFTKIVASFTNYNGQTIIYKTLQKKINTEQHELINEQIVIMRNRTYLRHLYSLTIK